MQLKRIYFELCNLFPSTLPRTYSGLVFSKVLGHRHFGAPTHHSLHSSVGFMYLILSLRKYVVNDGIGFRKSIQLILDPTNMCGEWWDGVPRLPNDFYMASYVLMESDPLQFNSWVGGNSLNLNYTFKKINCSNLIKNSYRKEFISSSEASNHWY